MLDPNPAHGRYTLRDVVEADAAWMWPAGCDALRPYVEPIYGWDEAVARVFFDKSFRLRKTIQVETRSAGWLQLERSGDWLLLHEIALLPEYRNGGLGGRILSDVLAYGDRHKLEVELQVLVNNPARHLYERFGFRTTHLKMSRQPV